MRRSIAMFAAATLAAGVFGIDPSVYAQEDINATAGVAVAEQQEQTQAKAELKLPDGVSQVQDIDREGIRRTLANATDAAFADDNLADLKRYFTQADQERLGEFSKHEQLNQQLQQLSQAWQQKYNEQFSFQAETVFGDQFQNFEIVQGEVTNPTLLANWPVDATRKGEMEAEKQYKERDIRYQTDEQQIEAETDLDEQDVELQETEERPGLHADVGGPGQPAYEVVPDQQRPLVEEDVTIERQPGTQQDDLNLRDQNGLGAEAEMEVGTEDEQIGTQAEVQTDQDQQFGAQAEVQTDQEQPIKASVRGQQHDLEQGENVALVTFPSQQNLPEVTASLVKGDADMWHIDIPNDLSSDQLQENLSNQISKVLEMQDQWPDDKTQAYRAVSHHLMMALYDVQADQTQEQPVGEFQQPQDQDQQFQQPQDQEQPVGQPLDQDQQFQQPLDQEQPVEQPLDQNQPQ